MVTYTLKLYTGDRAFAGTNSHVYVLLHGTEGATEEDVLNCCTGLWQGSERQFQINCSASLGELIMLEVYTKAFLSIENQWFCDKISVSTPEGETLWFPCYRWLDSDTRLLLRPATAKFVFLDTHPIAQSQRLRHLEETRGKFSWSVYAEGIPHTVNAATPSELPAEIRFSFTKTTEFQSTAAIQLAILQLKGLAHSTNQWKNFQELDQMFCEKRSQTYEYVQRHWEEDEFFGYQFLNGLNPMVIQRCSKLPDNFPVTEEIVEEFLRGSTLDKEINKGNIFLCDYKMLDGLVGNVVNDRQQYLTAPLVLLYCSPEGLMMPIAIQLLQEPGEENPIYLPSDSKHDWLLAKTFVRNAEFCVHEVNFHLLRTHLLAEVFTLATLRNLPTMHPLFKLLFPHIRYTLQINLEARNKLISESGAITMNAGVGGEALLELLKRATSSLTYSSLCLPENISERGLEDVPNYHYRDDGMRLWSIINKFVEGVLTHYYTSDDDVQRDSELQQWISEIFTKGFLGNQSTGMPQFFETVMELVKFVTMVIFNASAQHAAVNSGQFDFGGWMPNFPSALRKPPPKEKGQSTESTILETLPDVSTTVNSMAVLKLLSKESADRYKLGHFPEEWFGEEVPHQLIADFQKDLEMLSDIIEKRNASLQLPYTYLSPENVDNSVAI